jgi:acyl-CoA thioesterase FadM
MFESDRCVATTESVVVLLDPGTGRGAPLPDHVAQALEAYRPAA